MLPIPAIDIREGRCVRLLRGDFSRETVYGDPVEQARAFVDQGAPLLHVVDLDAARTGEAVNDRVIRKIVDEVAVPVQVGGGVRDRGRAEALLDRGVDRVVIGTMIIEAPDDARALAEAFPDRVLAGLDHHRVGDSRAVAARGWEQRGEVDLAVMLKRLAGAPFAGAVVTDIARDGTLEGPDIDGYRAVLTETEFDVIASGGVGTLDDVRALAAIDVEGRGLGGVIIGRALLSGAFTVPEAVAACAP